MNILFSRSLDISVHSSVLRLYAAVVLDENFEVYTMAGDYTVNEICYGLYSQGLFMLKLS